MNICGFNFFLGEKGSRVESQLNKIKEVLESNKKNKFKIIKNPDNILQDKIFDFYVTCGDVKISFNKKMIDIYSKINSMKKPRLIRDVTYLRIIPKLTNLDVNNFPRFTWNSILPNKKNFPYDPNYDRWSELKKKYGLKVKDYKKQGDDILFLLQIPTDASLNELNFEKDGYLNFMIKTINEVFKYTDRKIILRRHPLNKNNDTISNFLLKYYYKTGRLLLSKNEKLEKDFENIKCVISFNSSATVEALFAGIRVINLAKSQPCFSAASNKLSEIENLTDLDRDNFLKKIAFLHWENNELDSFENKKYLCNLLEKSNPLNNHNGN